MTETNDTIKTAVSLATTTAKQAADLATVAVKTATDLASKTAESNGIINTNMEWIKKSLTGIEEKLNEMDKAFVTAAQHAEVLKSLGDHETRINTLSSDNTRMAVMVSIGGGILTILVGLLIYHLFQI